MGSARNEVRGWTLASALGLTLTLSSCGGGTVPLPTLNPSDLGDSSGLVERGEYIVRDVAVCGHCHAADPHQDPDGPLSGGLAFKNWRLGRIRAANLTPDPTTGIGTWTEAEIVRALRSGNDKNGGLVVPVMPYVWFHGMSDRDALAVARYLKSQPPVSNRIDSDPNLIYGAAKLFFLGPEKNGHVEAPARGVTAEYGRYLANHVSLCGDCHTPRGGLKAASHMDHLFEGDDDSTFPANPANLTPDPETGIGQWSEDDFLRTLRTGVDPEGDSLHPFMPWRQLSRMTDEDLKAIYRYLMTLKPVRHEIPEKGREAE